MDNQKPLNLMDPALWPTPGQAKEEDPASAHKVPPVTSNPATWPSLSDAALWTDEARAKAKAQGKG